MTDSISLADTVDRVLRTRAQRAQVWAAAVGDAFDHLDAGPHGTMECDARGYTPHAAAARDAWEAALIVEVDAIQAWHAFHGGARRFLWD